MTFIHSMTFMTCTRMTSFCYFHVFHDFDDFHDLYTGDLGYPIHVFSRKSVLHDVAPHYGFWPKCMVLPSFHVHGRPHFATSMTLMTFMTCTRATSFCYFHDFHSFHDFHDLYTGDLILLLP